ncbi:MAG: hypothetical protein A3I43_02030 [Omnitrophica WOR_2 bacterium RIFCSPLOWO2_02_FULL_50_19]|nr:MAG: hypothetical protein A3I43_02030 [Omnitrophica WOR_2 bacterium RIFCSPLOWO2_02_FULL_50_19]
MKFWKGPKHFNILFARACIIAGSIGLIMEIVFKDWGGMLFAAIIMVCGGALYGFQALVWKWYEEKQKNVSKRDRL